MNYGKPNRADTTTTGELYPISQQERDEIVRSLVDALNAKEIVIAAHAAYMAAYKAQSKEINAAIESARQRANNAGIGTNELAASYLCKGNDDEV